MKMLTSWIAGMALASFVAAPAVAGTFYSWTTEDGTVSYTNDAKRIPAAYKSSAKRQSSGTLRGYKRYTPSAKAGGTHSERVSARLDHLRESVRVAHPSAAQPGTGVTLDFGTVEISAGSGGPGVEPLFVEEIQTRDPGHLSTRTVQVIRRGDRVVSVLAPIQNDRNISDVQSVNDVLGR